MRKYSVLLEYFREQGQESIFDRSIGEEDESYVLLFLTTDQCTLDRKAPYQPRAILGWGELQEYRRSVQILLLLQEFLCHIGFHPHP